MDLMGFHIVDIIIIGLVAFLAIKGLLNGFTKELLNFITIVAGVILAARYNNMIIDLINEQKLVPVIPEEFAKIIGFIIIILAVWLVIGVISSIITKLSAGPSGFFSRILGYILSAARYLFIFSLIVFGLSQSDFFKKSTEKFHTETKLFTPMAEFGAKILNLDVNQTTNENNMTSDLNLTTKALTSPIENNSTN